MELAQLSPPQRKWLKFVGNPQKKAEIRRQLILEGALRIVSEKGVSSLSNAELSRVTGLSKPLILYHFREVDEILQELFTMSLKLGRELTLRVLADKFTLEEKLSGVISGFYSWIFSHPQLPRLFLLLYYQSSLEKSVKKIHEETLRIGEGRIYSFLIESGRFKKCESTKTLALTLHNMVVGSILKMISANDEKNYKRYAKSLRQGISQVIDSPLPPIELVSHRPLTTNA